MRPDRLIVITGTGTDIGKTWVGAAVLTELRAMGKRVAARKPVQSFDPDATQPTDADVLAGASGEHPHDVCPPHRWYPIALAPPMAAAVLGLPAFQVADLIAETTWPAGIDIGLIEGAGGVHSPIADDGDTLSLIGAMSPDLVIVVADAELGTINNIRLTVDALSCNPCVVHLNRFDPAVELHRLNFDWLAERLHLTVTTTTRQLASVVLRE